MSRYSVSGPEGEFEPDSGEQVLANKLGVIDPREMEEIEARLLVGLYEQVLNYSAWYVDKAGYVSAIHAGHNHDYGPMETLFRRALPS